MTVHHLDGSVALDREEFPRPGTTADSLASLPSSFESLADFPLDEEGTTYRSLVLQKFPGLEITHVHHAGNSSGVVDGAAAILMTTPEYAQAHGLKPRARIVASANIGDDPTLMLNAPVPATKKVLARAGMSLADIDLFEVNEAFAPVPLAWLQALHADPARLNVNGGAIALGHPLGASGTRLMATLVHALRARGLRYGLQTMCEGGGIANATIIEAL